MRTSSLTNTTPVPRGAMEWDDPSESLTRKMSAADFAGLLNTHANEPGLYCDGSAQSNRLIAPLPSACALGTDPRGFFFKFRLPSNAPSSTTVLWYWGGANNGVGANSFACLINSSGALLFRLYGTNATDYRETTVASVLSTYGASREICVQFGADSSGRDCRINGLDATLTTDTTVNTNSTAPSDWSATITSTYFVWEGSIGVVFKSFWPANVRPALTDAQDSFFLGGGVPQGMRWGSCMELVTTGHSLSTGTSDANMLPSLTSGGANTESVQAETRMGGAGSFALRLTNSGSGWCTDNISALTNVYLPAARLTVWANGTCSNCDFSMRAFTGAQVGQITLSLGSGSAWVKNTLTWTSLSNYRVMDLPMTTRASGYVDLDDLSLKAIGALFFFSPHVSCDGCGFQLHDIGPYQVDAILPSSGWSFTHPTQRGYIRGTTNINGNQQLSATTLIPPNAQITKIRAKASANTPSITLGTSSGGSQLVASVSLSTTWKDLTIALAGGINSSTSSIWVGSNSTDTIATHLTYELLS